MQIKSVAVVHHDTPSALKTVIQSGLEAKELELMMIELLSSKSIKAFVCPARPGAVWNEQTPIKTESFVVDFSRVLCITIAELDTLGLVMPKGIELVRQ